MIVNKAVRTMTTTLCYVIIIVGWLACADAHYAPNLSRQRRQTLITSDFEPIDDIFAEQLIQTTEPSPPKRPSLSEYVAKRQKFVEEEFALGFESDVALTKEEQAANAVIKAAKEKELKEGFEHPYLFNPARHQFEVLQEIRKSPLFRMIQKMPKGGVLHAHDMALCSTDYIVSLTYGKHLWQCSEPNAAHRIKTFLFSRDEPASVDGCKWKLVSDERTRIGDNKYDRFIRTLFTLYREEVNPRTQFKDINDVWNTFMGIFLLLGPIVTYAPVWKDYYKNALTEMYADNVQYLEFRGLLPPVSFSFSYTYLLYYLRNNEFEWIFKYLHFCFCCQ